jgi:hypothetical protein
MTALQRFACAASHFLRKLVGSGATKREPGGGKPGTGIVRPVCNEDRPRESALIDRCIAEVKRRVEGALELPDEHWMRQSGPFPSVKHFFHSAFQSFEELLQYTALSSCHHVMDYGCGLARLGIPLTGFLDGKAGSYCGVDTDADCIVRNRRVFAAHPNFRFEHVNIYSKMYNRGGADFSVLAERDFGAPFDLVFLFSVFTHILPEHCDIMLRFIRSQLSPNGETFSSWFLLNEATERAIEAGCAHRSFAARHGSARIDNPLVPEGAVAHDQDEVLRRFEGAGFTDVRVHYGRWRGCEDSWVWQDIIVARTAS